jgi:SAM-dependent MidA family methyltransferase
MNPLQQKIIEKIKKEGPVTFKTFMEMALYEPELGYYTSQKTRIGRSGDFYTSSSPSRIRHDDWKTDMWK